MAKQQIMDLVAVCNSFPEIPKYEIGRDNFLDAIDDMFDNGIQVIIVEGEEGIGKTNFLSQFARRHSNCALSLFITSTSRYGYDPDNLRENLCTQLEWALHQKVLEITPDIDDKLLRIQLGRLQNRIHTQREIFYFVVDGLDEIPSSNVKYTIMEMFPWGEKNFRFLLSSDNYDELLKNIPPKLRIRPYRLSRFSSDETKRYFENLKDIVPELLDEIQRTYRGIPRRLEDVRRNLEAGTPVQDILDNMGDLLDLEWRRVRTEEEQQLKLLGIMAFSHQKHTLDDLARIVGIEVDIVKNILKELSFTEIQQTQVNFVSETWRKFVVDKLQQIRNLKNQVTNLLIDDLFGKPDDDVTRRDLPTYLEQVGRYEDILEYLSPEHCTRALEISQSLSLIQQHLDLGIKTAQRLNRDKEFIRFSAQKSAIAEFDEAKAWKSEIEAKIALNDYVSALDLAHSATLKHDRLHLLAIIAKARRERGLSQETEIEQIKQLYNQIDWAILGKRVFEIAADLIYVNQDLAIKMVEQATRDDTDENSRDWAIAGLSTVAQDSNKEQAQTSSIEIIWPQIKNPEDRRFSAAVSLMLGKYSAARVIAEAKKLTTPNDQLFLLRRWTMENRERDDAAEVVDFAYHLAIDLTQAQYIPTRDLREIATPLPFIKDETKAKQLVSKFHSQLGITERYGPTEDHVRLQLLLAQTESKYDLEAAKSRIEEIYYFIDDLDDLAIKTKCLARLMASLTQIDPNSRLEVKDKIHTSVANNLEINIGKLLESTAEHYHATRGIIIALAKTHPEQAFNLAMRLNTEKRRDVALFDMVESAIQLPVDRLDLSPIEKALNSFVNLGLRGNAVFAVIVRLSFLSEKIDNLPDRLIQQTLFFINSIKDIQDARQRCNAYCLAYTFLTKQDNSHQYTELASNLLYQLDFAWQSIDVRWLKVYIGFEIVKSLADDAPEKAREYLKSTNQVRSECTLDTETAALTYLRCLRLSLRAYSGLLPKQADSPEDMNSLTELIDKVPSCGEQAGLWAELALRLALAGRLIECEQIVTERVKPLLAEISDKDTEYRARVLVVVAPALYRAHAITALDLISKLPQPERDQAYAGICEFLLRQQMPMDPYERLVGQGYKNVTSEKLMEICELLNLMDFDHQIYHFIECIASSIVSRYSRKPFSNELKFDIANRLANVISKKLPSPRHIKHDGYKIVAQAQILRIKETTQTHPKLQEWQKLVESAHKIQNLADKPLVLCMVAATIPSRWTKERQQVFEEAMEIIKQMPSRFDKTCRYVDIANLALSIDDQRLFRNCLKSAMNLAIENDNSEFYPIQRRIIDLADKIDPDFATTLAKLADDDPARSNIKTNLQKYHQLLKLKKQMAEVSPNHDFSSSSEEDLVKAAWMNLSALNSGRINPVPFDNIQKFIRVAAGLPLSQSYPILAWIIENGVRRWAETDQAGNYLRSIYEAMLLGVKLSERMAARSSRQLEYTMHYTTRSSNDEGSMVVSRGEREKALKFIRDWFANKVQDYLKIHDPYFGPDDLEILQLLSLENPTCTVQILTSQKRQQDLGLSEPWQEPYRNHWHIHISEQDPPDTEIVIIGTKSGNSPIHDRWWLTKSAGIRLGSSLNGLGGIRISEISFLSKEEAEEREKIVDQYLYGSIRKHEGENLNRWSFPLSL